MTVNDFILNMADGIRAGTLKLEGGTASIDDIGQTYIETSKLDDYPRRTPPLMFTLKIDATYVQVK